MICNVREYWVNDGGKLKRGRLDFVNEPSGEKSTKKKQTEKNFACKRGNVLKLVKNLPLNSCRLINAKLRKGQNKLIGGNGPEIGRRLSKLIKPFKLVPMMLLLLLLQFSALRLQQQTPQKGNQREKTYF